MGLKYYALKGRKIVRLKSMEEVIRSFENFDDRQVARTYYEGVSTSTVFLMLDHNYSETGPPVLFETMVFDDADNGYEVDKWTQRYCTFEQALAGHMKTIDEVRAMVDSSREFAQQFTGTASQEKPA